jgi:hypothetical protein
MFDRAVSLRNSTGVYPFVLTGVRNGAAWGGLHEALRIALTDAGLGGATRGEFLPHITLAYDKLRVKPQPIEPVTWGERFGAHTQRTRQDDAQPSRVAGRSMTGEPSTITVIGSGQVADDFNGARSVTKMVWRANAQSAAACLTAEGLNHQPSGHEWLFCTRHEPVRTPRKTRACGCHGRSPIQTISNSSRLREFEVSTSERQPRYKMCSPREFVGPLCNQPELSPLCFLAVA